MARKAPNQAVLTELPFPIEGVDDTRAYLRQRNGTCVDAQNVRAFDPETDRAQGAARAGLTRYNDDAIVGEGVPIQEICHVVANEVPGPPTTVGDFIYARASGSAFGKGDGATGSSVWTVTGTASFAFACCCFDEAGYVYVAQVNTTTGAVRIQKIKSSDAAVSWTQSTSITVNTGSLRNICGMVIINESLYVALKKTSGTITNTITKMNASTGAVTVAQWYNNVSSATLVFSTSAVNCLGKLGNLLGIECVATAALQCFKIIDVTKLTGTVPTATAVKSTAYNGTAANNRSRVVSDNINYFYTIASTTTGIVKKISSGGVVQWSSTVFDSAGIQGLAYDFSTGYLVGVTTTSPSARRINLSTAASAATADPGSVTAWHYIDSDNQGYFTLWRNSVASNDVMQMNSTMTTVWGPSTLANTTHSGAAVDKGQLVQVLPSGIRAVRLLAWAGGTCKLVTRTAVSSVTTGNVHSHGAKQIFTAQQGVNLYVVDGSVYYYYKSSNNTMTAWTASAGSMPTDDQTGKARLICNWLDRICLAGFPRDPRIIYLSKVADPSNWNTAPATTTSDQAFAINSKDLVNCLVPYGDDTLIVGGDHTIHQFTGDPGIGGQFDLLSENVGMAWGQPFAIDPQQQIYFYSSRGGVYKMQPGTTPVLVSQKIKRRITGIDLSVHSVSMAWDVEAEGLGVWITPHDETKDGINFFFEQRTEAWWPDFYANKKHCVTAAHTFDGDDPNDRVILLGNRDGRIRFVDITSDKDDNEPIQSYVVLGPIKTAILDDVMVVDMQATLADASGTVSYDVYMGETPEAALASMEDENGTLKRGVRYGDWAGGRNKNNDVNRSGHTCYIKASSTDYWALEKLYCRYAPLGMVRRRG